MRELIISRFNDNLARARNLVNVYRVVARQGQGRQRVQTVDVLRAAVVFLHAALEEVFRNIALWKYPAAPERVLNEIPLAGSTDNGRAEKFFLGRLAFFRGRSVDDVIAQSVQSYMGYFTVNSTADISSFLTRLDVDVNLVNQNFAVLNELINRRHHIVHQADRQRAGGRGNHRAQQLNETTVTAWVTAVEQFVPGVMAQLPD